MPSKSTCGKCGKAFTPATFWQRYCSAKCRIYQGVNAWRKRKGLFKSRRPRTKSKPTR